MELAQRIFAVVFALGVLFLWLVLIWWTVKSLSSWRKLKKAPVENLHATVSRCFEQEDYVFQYGETVVAHYMVEFTTEDHRTFLFSLTPGEYRNFRQGDSGLLRLQNEDFVSFQSLTTTGQTIFRGENDHERVYRKIVRGK